MLEAPAEVVLNKMFKYNTRSRMFMAEMKRPFRRCVECGLVQRVDLEVRTPCIVCEVYTEMMRYHDQEY